MAHRAVAIANEFLKLPGARETLTQMQLQKLTFIANGWNIVINGEPLIQDPAEAWTYGPVYRDLYEHTRFFGKEPINRLVTPDDSEAARVFLMSANRRQPPYEANPTPRERDVIRHVWNRYGDLSGFRLSELTHQRGTPWFEAFTERGKNSLIDEKSIKKHYEELARKASENVGA